LDEQDIRQHAWAGLVEFTLKYRSAVRNVEAFCDILLPWLKNIEQQQGESYCKAVLNYVVNVLDIDDEKIFVQKIQEHLTGNLRGEAMTLAQRFEQKGIEKGIEREKIIIAERMLSEGYDFNTITKLTQLTTDKLLIIKKNLH